jgi:hypothetical protein
LLKSVVKGMAYIRELSVGIGAGLISLRVFEELDSLSPSCVDKKCEI